MQTNMHFIDHLFLESEMDSIKSKFNKEEAELVLCFASYLIKNLYKISEITILTLYTGQLMEFTKLIKSKKYIHLQYISVKTVDNFQGEENKIILLSLVRSNIRNNIGFLKVSNRVCVALSRAKEGF